MLEFIVVEGTRHRRIEIGTVPVVLGRTEESDVVIDSALASRRHARFDWDEDALWVEDLDSRNGTRLNGTPISRAEIQPGDHVLIGDAELTFVGGEVASAADAPPVIAGFDAVARPLRTARFRVHAVSSDPDTEILLPRRAWNEDEAGEAWLARAEAIRRAGVSRPLVQTLGRDDGRFYVVLGGRVGRGLDDELPVEGGWPMARVAGLLKDLLGGLASLHQAGVGLGGTHPEDWRLDAQGRHRLASIGAPPVADDPIPWTGGSATRDPIFADVHAVGRIASAAVLGWDDGWTADEAASLGDARVLERGGAAPPLAAFLASLQDDAPGERPADAEAALRALEALERTLAAQRGGDGGGGGGARGGGRGRERGADRGRQGGGGSPDVAPEAEAEPPRRIDKSSTRWKVMNRAIAAVIIIVLNLGFALFWRSCVVGGDEPVQPSEPTRAPATGTPGGG